MNTNEIISWCRENRPINSILEIPEHYFKHFTLEQAEVFKSEYPNDTMFKLPEREIQFFEWLKLHSNNIWADLWSDDLFPPYYVSIALFHRFLDSAYLGYPICELRQNDNYYFVPQHLADKESVLLVDSAKSRYIAKEALTVQQWLALSISVAPVDIWHFAYKNDLSIQDCMESVKLLVDENLLVHLKEAEHLSVFVEI
ncbi:MAG TPA: hypothetical protein PLE30_02525 [Candidatus Kapabacteria bacterium]|nr:hypothetical protein [Candidatus Kapabacteria bacterium]